MPEKNKIKGGVDDWMKDDIGEPHVAPPTVTEVIPEGGISSSKESNLPFPKTKSEKAYAPYVRPEGVTSYESTPIVAGLEAEAKESKKQTRSRVRYAFEFYQDQLDDITLIVRAFARKKDIQVSKSKMVRLIMDEGINELKKQLKI